MKPTNSSVSTFCPCGLNILCCGSAGQFSHLTCSSLISKSCNTVSFSSHCSRECFFVSVGALCVIDGDCPRSLSRKGAHYSMTLKGHSEGAINLQMNMSASFQGGGSKDIVKVVRTNQGYIGRRRRSILP